jgi:hypothetical protein
VPGQTPQGEQRPSIYLPAEADEPVGRGGTYVFTDLEHLDRIIGRWKALHEDLLSDSYVVGEAMRTLVAPAEDSPSVTQAEAVGVSLGSGQDHNQAMANYARAFIEKLEATRAEYAATEDDNTRVMRGVDP